MNHPAFLWVTTLPSNVVLAAATLGPFGHWRKAPGTIGSALGILLYTVLFYPLGPLGELLLSLFLVYLAIGICGEAEKRLWRQDPSEVILDEFVAIPFCFLGLKQFMYPGNMWMYMLAGFLLFRFFDILKPFGINRLQRLEGGIGIVADDIAAALATCLCLHLLAAFVFPGYA